MIIKRLDNGVHLAQYDRIHTCMDERDSSSVVTWEGLATGAEVTIIISQGTGICRVLNIIQLISKRMVIMLGTLMSHDSSSTLMHQVLRSRVRWQKKS